MTIHFGNPSTSSRLRETDRMISRKRGATTAQVEAVTGSVCVHTDIAELRQFYGSQAIPKAVYAGKSAKGRKIYRYFHLVK